MATENEKPEGAKEFEVRLAQPGDVDQLAALHQATFTPQEHLLILFGTTVLRPIYRWFVDSPETFTVAASVAGRIVGLCTACDRPYNGPMVRRNRLALALGALRHPGVLFHPEIQRRLKAALTGPKKGEAAAETDPPAQFGFLAVHREYHGTPVAEALLRRAVEECRVRQWRRVRAGVYKQNLPARFMYSKLGFQENKALRTEQMVFVELDLCNGNGADS
ncbi:GNAT family N-acetyltransferase [Geomonas nitrogeniifigens]|uniref:GNAT family N-acetyltransferase n=1 Tax=Geomonas diazotrophica TaxID=2843197 RepID=A0ABX8JFN8_9BACT|nr:GNAT family N-acetyltransferase [Geomonas nitrogeniifigens]QWV95956.1 GNAT family N-acetyltransferase [Geomonas nitrogeniifigens]